MSLKVWMGSLDNSPHPMAEAIEGQPDTPIRKRARAEHVFWRLCVMINSIHSMRGSKALEASTLPANFEATGQSYMDRLYTLLSGWDHSFVIGPSLHSSLSFLFVTRGIYQRMDTCPKLAQKMIHRIICIVYKDGLQISNRVFGLKNPGGSTPAKRKRAPATPSDTMARK